MSQFNPCPRCGGSMSESVSLPLYGGRQYLGPLYLHCTRCSLETLPYGRGQTDLAIAAWNAGQAPIAPDTQRHGLPEGQW